MLQSLGAGLAVGTNVAMSVLVMFLLMVVGFVMKKKDILKQDGIKQITELVLIIVVPSVIIDAYQRDFDPAMAKNLCISLVFSLVIHLIAFVICPLIFRTREKGIDVFCAVYSNCGFMALPLVQALYGSEGVFYAVTYVAVFNVLYWTHGVYLYTQDKKQLSLKKAFLTPGVLGTAAGLLIFFLQIKLPSPVTRAVSLLAALNTPLPMIILGTYLVSFNIKTVFDKLSVWGVCLFRLIVYPIIGILLSRLVGIPTVISMPLVVSCSCPSATAAVLFAIRYGKNSEYASQIVSISTLLSVITIPVVMTFATMILQ